MKRQILEKLLLFILVLCFVQGKVNAQVTIGSTNKPIDGALLMLDDDTRDNLKPMINATKGLVLPRVNLMKSVPTSDADFALSIEGSGSWDRAAHTGLVVYNVLEREFDPATCKYIGAGPVGLYLWNGSKWEGIGVEGLTDDAPDIRTVTDDGSKITLSYNGETTSYHYSSFGAAGIWMTENLATQYLPDGTLLPKHRNGMGNQANSAVNPQYYIPGDKASITVKEGLLYNWPAAMDHYICSRLFQSLKEAGNPVPGDNEVESVEETSPGAKDGKIKGICPTGWHLPSDREWNQLEKVMTEQASQYTQTPLINETWIDDWEIASGWRGANHGTAMKSKGIVINGINPKGDSRPAISGGFDVLLTGNASVGAPYMYGNSAYFWTSSATGPAGAYSRILYSNPVDVSNNPVERAGLFSVRCKKD